MSEKNAKLDEKSSAQTENSSKVPPDMVYTKELRAATNDVHRLTDILVNAKFAFALSDDSVWADGLLSFYEIYKFFEEHLPPKLLPVELHRTASFEKDFEYFWGRDWRRNYEIRPCVQKYIEHLEEVNAKNQILLFAYAYQMYMALMSGGQLLQKKRMIARKLWPGRVNADTETVNRETEAPSSSSVSESQATGDLSSRPMPVQVCICPPGCAATYFPEKIDDLKSKLRHILNQHYKDFDEKTKAEFIEESRNVFLYNSDVVRNVKGVNRSFFRRLVMVVLFFVGVFIATKISN